MASLCDDLTTILGVEHVLGEPEACAAYAVQGVTPGCVAAPGSVEELQAVLRAAHERRAAVAPWGGGTQQRIGGPPARLDLVVRTGRLSRVLVHEPDDLTISVEAGVTMGALRAHLAQYGQMLPLDPPLPQRATIGGLVATAADGPRRLGYGTLRDLLIGIAVVEADGRLSRAGGMVVKNVSGFDMMKLYLGSYGTLAVVVSANFKLLPAPRAAGSLLCRFASPQQAFAAAEALQQTQLTPTAVEYLNAGALALVSTEGREVRSAGARTAGPPIGAGGTLGTQTSGPSVSSVPAVAEARGGCALVVRAEGLPQAVERHLADAAGIAGRSGALAAERLEGSGEAELWARVADLPQAVELAPGEALVKLSVLPADVERAAGVVEALADAVGAQAAISARALSGTLYARLCPLEADVLAGILERLPGLQWVATDLPGTPRWGPPPQGIEVMRRIKREFDPQNCLNPGRFVPGIEFVTG
ncbi:MAG TPA: FAD-binding oxidoreductase [Roseiflexaceae bacterium]|nr:FAD-binding oxidoreductase [Roseiflexaceae bacterium]